MLRITEGSASDVIKRDYVASRCVTAGIVECWMLPEDVASRCVIAGTVECWMLPAGV